MKTVRHILRWICIGFICSTVLAVVAYRFIPVYVTPLMLIRSVGMLTDSKQVFRWHHSWVSLSDMSVHMPVAIMAGEDSHFLSHHGFDFNAIQKAREHNQHSKKIYGASTISQQTAKNVFLWPGNTNLQKWIRKGFEAYFTVLIEMMWSKQRIMEVYLNSIEMGDGIYGLQAVAEDNFGKNASELTRDECALIAATIPNPHIYDSKNPSRYVRKRQKRLLNEMRYIGTFPREGEDLRK